MQFSGLLVVAAAFSTLFIATLTRFEFRRVRFNFNAFSFSLLFLLTFFFLVSALTSACWYFVSTLASRRRNLIAGSGHPPPVSTACVLRDYKRVLRKRVVVDVPRKPLFTMNRVGKPTLHRVI